MLDATLFSEENEVNVPWMRELHKLVPAAVLANVQSIVILNPSSGARHGPPGGGEARTGALAHADEADATTGVARRGQPSFAT